MTQQEARRILEEWIKRKNDLGAFHLPIVDNIVYTKVEDDKVTDYTFIFLLKTAYPNLSK